MEAWGREGACEGRGGNCEPGREWEDDQASQKNLSSSTFFLGVDNRQIANACLP